MAWQCRAQPCEGKHYNSQYCSRHYQRWLKYGDPYQVAFTYLTFDSPDLALHFWNQATVTSNPDKCWDWHGDADKDGYGRIRIGGKRYRAHRLALFLQNGQHPNSNLLVLHSCDNPRCVNPQHLREGTSKENSQDMFDRNRENVVKGTSHYNASLNESIVRYIKTQKRGGVANIEIARELNISHKTIWAIDHEKSWKYVII